MGTFDVKYAFLEAKGHISVAKESTLAIGRGSDRG